MERLEKKALWRRVRRYVEQKRETPKVDFKTTLDLTSGRGKSELAKDISAIANTPGEQGFLIIGVKEQNGEIELVGFRPNETEDEYERRIIQILEKFIEPSPPEIQYYQIEHPRPKVSLGVLRIISTNRPYAIKRDGETIRKGDIYIRHGTRTERASREEIIQMSSGSAFPREIIVLNFSTHPLTSEQKRQIERKDKVFIGEIIEVPAHFIPDSPLKQQVEELIQKTDLTPGEWSSQNLYLILPGLAPASAAVLSYIHGLRGSFPKVVWIYQSTEDPTLFEVVQIINLQEFRDTARKKRTSKE